MHSIRFRITAITIAEILTTILCIFLVSFSIIQTQSDTSSVEMMDLIAKDTRKSLEKYMDGIEQSVEMVAHIASDSLDSVVLIQSGIGGANSAERTTEQVERLDSYLAGYCNNIQTEFASVAGHTRGIVTYYYCISPDVSTTQHGFFYSRIGKTGYREREPIDARELDPNDKVHTTWYYTPIQRGRPSWVGPYKAHFLDEMSLCSFLTPVYKSGTLIGVMGMDLPMETITALVSSIHVYDNGYACLLDSDGTVLYHPNAEPGSTLDLPINEQVVGQEDNGNALIRYTADGEERQVSFTTLSNGMKLMIVAPVDEVNASSTQLMRTIPPLTVLIVAIIALLTMFVMRYITQPLLNLTAASRRLASADYNVELNYKGKDEVGALTASFKTMRSQLESYIDDLNRRIHADDLTGLSNQRYFFTIAAEERRRMLDEGRHPAILFFNLVGMKHFNRQYGFAEGDRLICAIAEVLASHYGVQRTSSFGQDHFAVITDDEHLERRLVEVFEDCAQANGGKSLPVSVGIYLYDLEDVVVSVACDRAKFACDQRRGTYFSGFYYFDAQMLEKVMVLRHVVDHLDQAIEERWIEVYYQPIVHAVSGRVCDEEALSRWIDPERGLLSPADFISGLEDSGLIYKLDLYVLDRVLEKMRLQEQLGLTVVSQSVNLSRSDFDACDIVEEICNRVDAAGVDRSMISIEITESIIGSDFDFMKEQVERFRQLGFPVWIDDFGSGYSSLDYLQSIEFDLIKFDMSFLRKLDDGDAGKVILTELMQMATALGVDTICEGVETEDQIRFLQEIGCSKLQGYYYCRPIPFEQIVKRYETGVQIGFENPDEAEYYGTIGKANLHDLTTVVREGDDSLQNIFNTLPMGILELQDDEVTFARMNHSCRLFILRYFGPRKAKPAMGQEAVDTLAAESFLGRYVQDCCAKGGRTMFNDRLPDGSLAHFIARRLGTNPISGKVAVAIAVLSVVEPGDGPSYASIVQALVRDYYKVYYVDLATDRYITYNSVEGSDELAEESHGEDFFYAARKDAMDRIDARDLPLFLERFTKEQMVGKLEAKGFFTARYRLADDEHPTYIDIKVTQLKGEGIHIVIGTSLKTMD